jgi:hypothetical protein
MENFLRIVSRCHNIVAALIANAILKCFMPMVFYAKHLGITMQCNVTGDAHSIQIS